MPAIKKPVSDDTQESLALKGIEYLKVKDLIKELEGRSKEIRVPLENLVKSSGVVLPSGSLLSVLPYADKEIHLKETLRTSRVLLPEALDTLNKLGLTECIEHAPIIREDVIERLYGEGKITDEILCQLYAVKKSFAFSVELKNKMPDDVEETM